MRTRSSIGWVNRSCDADDIKPVGSIAWVYSAVIIKEAEIRSALTQCWSGAFELSVFDELDSTNKHLIRSLDADAGDPHICATGRQTAGVGRRGKVWHSPPDSITFSIRQTFSLPASRMMGLSLVTGVAVAETLAGLMDFPVQLKWPNDVVVDGRKLAGILVEIPRASGQTCSVVTGIGLNYRAGPEHGEIDQPVAVLESYGQLPERAELIGRLAASVLGSYKQFQAMGWAAFAERWRRYDGLSGHPVTVMQGMPPGDTENPKNPVTHTGVARGVSDDGGLIVEHPSRTATYYSGEVSVRRQR